MFKRANLLFVISLAIVVSTLSVAAQDTPVGPTAKAPAAPAAPAAGDTAALAKATQNPVASLNSVPLQNNSNFGIGPYNRTGDIFNIQPVIPMKLSDNVMLIARVIQPLVWQPYPSQPSGGQTGIGDMNPDVLPVAGKARQAHLWGGTGVYFAHSDEHTDWSG
jgi:hypothetical protein